MIQLKADNRQLVKEQPSTVLTTNYATYQNSLVVVNDDPFDTNKFILLGNIGSPNAEILRVSSVNRSSHTLSLASYTKYAHPESTRVTLVPYDKIRFYWTATNGFNPAGAFATASDLTPTSFFTVYNDESHSTGFGWYTFYNSQTLVYSQPSNPIPYAGFDEDTVREAIDYVFSQMNQKERRLVTVEEVYEYLNEGYSQMRQELALVNSEYGTSVAQTLTTTPGTAEYALPTDFIDMISIVDANKQNLMHVDIMEIDKYSNSMYWSQPRYYIRGKYIGFTPTPDQALTFEYRYVAKGNRLDSYDDVIDLPDDGYYALRDYCLSRAFEKLQNDSRASSYAGKYNARLNLMKITAIRRERPSDDSWRIAPSANV